MSGWLIVCCGTSGTYLLTTSVLAGWTGIGIGPRSARPRVTPARQLRRWLDEAGLHDVAPREFVAVTTALAATGAVIGAAIFGGPLPALGAGASFATVPAAAYRRRRADRLATAEDSWPAMIEEIRVLTGSAGRSIPHALFDVGVRAPAELRPAFETAQREWMLTTDFARSLDLLTSLLGSPTADTVCETLLVAHELGGVDIARRLAELAEDRRHDGLARKDARAKQAGVRFARRFVIAVPAGMALAGMSLGEGRASYQTPLGQTMVVLGLALMVACWIWSGRMLRLPIDERVFG